MRLVAMLMLLAAPAFAATKGTTLSNRSYPSALAAARAEAARRIDADPSITGKKGTYGMKMGANMFSAQKIATKGSVRTYQLTANTAIGGGFPDFVTNVKARQLKSGQWKAYQQPGNNKTITETFP